MFLYVLYNTSMKDFSAFHLIYCVMFFLHFYLYIHVILIWICKIGLIISPSTKSDLNNEIVVQTHGIGIDNAIREVSHIYVCVSQGFVFLSKVIVVPFMDNVVQMGLWHTIVACVQYTTQHTKNGNL